MTCNSCGIPRPASALLAYWPVADPTWVRYCCRPNDPSPGTIPGLCFRRSVESVAVHTIAPADKETRR